MATPEEIAWREKFAEEMLAEILVEMAAEEGAREAAIAQANRRHVELLSDLPVRVQVRRHETDTYDVCDLGRIGWVRREPAKNAYGHWHAYIEDMSSGDDSCPTRYHQPLNLFPVEES